MAFQKVNKNKNPFITLAVIAVLLFAPFRGSFVVLRSTFPSTFSTFLEAINFLCDDNDDPKRRFGLYRTTIAELVFYLFNKNPLFCPVLGN